MNIKRNFEATLWRHRWRHHHKNFFWYDLGRSVHVWGQIDAVVNISKFSKWPPFWACDKMFYRKLYLKLNITPPNDSHEHFRHFELLIGAVTQILAVIYQFQNLTYFVTWWRHQWRHEYMCITFDLQSRKELFIEIVFWHVWPRKTIMILVAFTEETLPLHIAPGAYLS